MYICTHVHMYVYVYVCVVYVCMYEYMYVYICMCVCVCVCGIRCVSELQFLFFLLDTNECASNNGGCDQNCFNQIASYYCTCNEGYTLDGDKHTCNGK